MLTKTIKATDRTVYDFPVEIIPHILDSPMARYIKGDTGGSVIRKDTNTILGNVSSNYSLIRHSSVVKAVEGAMEINNILFNMDSIVMFGKEHSSMCIQYSLAHSIKGFSPLLSVKNSYDKTCKLSMTIGIKYLKCLNGMTGFKTWNLTNVKHIGENNGDTLSLKIFEKLNEYIGLQFPELIERIETLKSIPTTKESIIASETFPTFFETKTDYENFIKSPLLSNNINEHGNNLFAVLQAMSEYATHYEQNPDRLLKYQDTIFSFLSKHSEQLS
jgi:hypothetical protein